MQGIPSMCSTLLKGRTRPMTHQSYTVQLLAHLLDGKQITAFTIDASNQNQYINQIKNAGIILTEKNEPNIGKNGTHKVRSLHQSPENVKRAKAYLKILLKK